MLAAPTIESETRNDLRKLLRVLCRAVPYSCSAAEWVSAPSLHSGRAPFPLESLCLVRLSVRRMVPDTRASNIAIDHQFDTPLTYCQSTAFPDDNEIWCLLPNQFQPRYSLAIHCTVRPEVRNWFPCTSGDCRSIYDQHRIDVNYRWPMCSRSGIHSWR